MSTTAVIPFEGLRQALCVECGSVRSASARYLGRGSRLLRCAPCGRATSHAAVNWDGADSREEANQKRNETNAEQLRELEALVRLFRSCRIDVLIDEGDQVNPEAGPQGGLVDVVRWLNPEGYLVRLQSGLSVSSRAYCLDWAWRNMRPAGAHWDLAEIETDLDGEPFQRIYNRELEGDTFIRP